jgi:hypothetical protein
MIDTELPEILRVLRQDRGHVVLVVSQELVGPLVTRLTRELVDSMRVGIARFAGHDESSAAECVLSALGVLSSDEALIRARIELERLADLGTSLTLLIPGALAVDPNVLRDLAELATQSGNVLRLALIAERDSSAAEDPATWLVSALGTGAAKIEVAPPSRPPSVNETAQTFGPPRVVSASPPRRARPIPVRSARPTRRRPGIGRPRRRGLLIASILAVVALPLSLWALSPPDDPVPTRLSPDVAPLGTPFIDSSASPPVSSPGAALDEKAPAPAQLVIALAAPVAPPVTSRESEPLVQVLEKSAAKKADGDLPQAEEPVAPSRVQRVPVNLNAWPYAEIVVDGEAIGPTPIANHPLTPGWHSVRAVFPDGRVSERRIQVDSLQNHFRIR